MIHIRLLINPGQDIKIQTVHFILVVVVFSWVHIYLQLSNPIICIEAESSIKQK